MIRLCVVFVVLIFSVSFGVYTTPSTHAQAAASSWLKSSRPSMQLINSSTSLDPYALGSCTPDTKFITTPKRLYQNEVSYTGCATNTAFGQTSDGPGFLKLNGMDIAGPVQDANGSSILFMGLPNSPDLLYLRNGSNGTYYSVVKDFAAHSTVGINPNGTIYHRLKPNTPIEVIMETPDKTLNIISRFFSTNSQWMIGDTPLSGRSRVNLKTGQTTIFGDVYNYSNGLSPKFISAISSNGRYALITESEYNVLKLYDLSTCTPNPPSTTTSACQKQDMWDEMPSLIPGFKRIVAAQFSTDYSIRLYVAYETAGQTRYGHFLMTAAGETESKLDYLALGDSFTSGEGAYVYKPGTDIQQPFNKCHLSQLSYPYLLSSRLSLNRAESVACSGAKIKDISSDTDAYRQSNKQSEGKESPSFDTEIYRNFLVGYRPQLDFVEQNKPHYVTISISGNDFGFGKILLSCLMPGTCFEQPQSKLDLVHTIDKQANDIINTFKATKAAAGTGATIYAIGYPSLAEPNGNCALNVRLNREEIVFSNQLIHYINSTIRQAAAKAEVTYIDVESALKGHRLCETASSAVAVNGLTVGDDKTTSIPLKISDNVIDLYLTGRESYHPNQLGHHLYANTIARATDNFKMQMPDNPPTPDSSELLRNVPDSLLPRKIFYQDITSELLIKNKPATITSAKLLPNSGVSVLIDEAIVPIMTTAADPGGSIAINPVIPTSVMPGLHFIKLQAKNQAGEDILMQQLVYIAHSEIDIDGDSIPNDKETCLLADPSNSDQDEDGVDDACDNLIDKQPPVISSRTEQDIKAGELTINSSSTPNKLQIAMLGSYASLHTASIPTDHVLSSAGGATTKSPPQSPDNHLEHYWWLLPFILITHLIYLLNRWRRKAQKGTIELS